MRTLRLFTIALLSACLSISAYAQRTHRPVKTDKEPRISSVVQSPQMFEKASKGAVIVGTEALSGFRIPIEPYYGYTYSQCIYLQPEINTEGYINRIAYYYTNLEGYPQMITSCDWVIYIATSDKTEFASTTDWVPISEFTKVFEARIEPVTEEGWLFFDLETPFYYDNTQNLIIAVEENQIDYDRNEDEFLCTATTGYRSISYRSDSNNPDPETPPTATVRNLAIANVQLVFAENIDMAITDILGLQYPFTNDEVVSIKIKNYGLNQATNFEVSYTFDGITFTETFTDILESNTEVEYTFLQPIDLSLQNVYEITANVNLTDDENTGNNELSKFINTIENQNGLHSFQDYLSENWYFNNSVMVKDNDMLDFENFTIETWFYPAYPSDWAQVLISKFDNYNWDKGYFMYFENNYVAFYMDQSNQIYSGEVLLNNWYHVAVTYDGTNIMIYLNGELSEELNYVDGYQPTDFDLYVAGIGNPWQGFLGEMDETRVWNRALTQEEIQKNMHIPLNTDEPIENLVLYFDYNQGISANNNQTITHVWDKSGNNFHGQLLGYELLTDVSNFVENEVLLILEQPQSIDICEFGTYEFSVEATGSISITYQWQVSTDDGVSFVDITDEIENSLIFIADETSIDNLYKCVITDGGFETETNVVSIVLHDIPIAVAGDNHDACGLVYELSATEPTIGTGTWTTAAEGNFDNASLHNATFTAENYGSVEFTWTVETDFCSNFDVVTITFNEIPTADFEYEKNALEVSFTNLSVNATSFEWDFGDGSVSTDENPTYTYADAGDYTVTLTAYSENCENEFSLGISVEVPIYTLTITIVGNGSVDVDGEEYTTAVMVDEGTELNLEAIAEAGWEFDSWTGEVADALEAITTITMDSDKSITVTFTEVVSVTNLNVADITIYPNPSTGNFKVVSEEIISEIFIFNLVGKIVYSKTLDASNIELNINNIEEGMYFVRITTTGGEKTMKLQIAK
jgi:PKD repeat protein